MILTKDYSLFFLLIKQDNIWRKQGGTEEAVDKNIYIINTSNIVKSLPPRLWSLMPQVSMRAFRIVNTFSWITLTSFMICKGFHRTVLWIRGCQQPVNLTLLRKQRHYHNDHLQHQILLWFNTNVHKLWPLYAKILPSMAIFSFSQKDPLQPVNTFSWNRYNVEQVNLHSHHH